MIGYLDPKNDVAFRKIFGINKDLCISFINSLLPLPEGKHVVDLEYIDGDPSLSPRLQYCSVVSAICVDNEGERIDVAIIPTFDCLSEYRFLKNIQAPLQGETGRIKVYILPVVFELFPESAVQEGESVVFRRVRKQEGCEMLMDDTLMVMVETKCVAVGEGTMRDKWLSFLKYFGEDSMSICLTRDDMILKAMEILRVENFSVEEERRYVHYWNYLSNERNIVMGMTK